MAGNVVFGAVLQLKDEFTRTLKIALKQQKTLKEDAERVRKTFRRAYNQKHKLIIDTVKATKSVQAVQKSINKLKASMKPLRNALVVGIALKDAISSKLKPITSKLGNLVRKPFTAVVKLKDNTASTFKAINDKIANIKNALSGLGIGAAVGALGGGLGVGAAISKGSTLEQQIVSMEHFMSVNNMNKSADEIVKMREEYIAALRKNAAETPFSDSEVIEAGTRALGIAQGNVEEAFQLVKLAEDMAALTPGKTIMDAMEALADAQMGEMERMKEFGFKSNQELFQKSGGNILKLENLQGKTITDLFAGGAEKLSKTGAGKWNAISGNLSAIFQDMGFAMLESLKPALDQIAELVERYRPQIVGAADAIAKGFGLLVNGAMRMGSVVASNWDNIKGVVSSVWGVIEPIYDRYKQVVVEAIPVYRDAFSKIVSTVQQHAGKLTPIIQVVQKVIGAMGNVVKTVVPIVADIFAQAFPIIADMVGMVSRAISWLVDNIITPSIPVISTILTEMWEVVQPILQGLWDAIKIITDIVSPLAEAVFKPVFEGIVSAVDWAWGFLKPIFDGIEKGLGWVKKGLGWMADTFGWGSGDDDDEDGKKSAWGISRVPYDNYPIIAHEGERLLTKQQANQLDRGLGGVNIAKLADTVIVREEADIEKIADAFVRKLEQSRLAYGG